MEFFESIIAILAANDGISLSTVQSAPIPAAIDGVVYISDARNCSQEKFAPCAANRGSL